MTSKTNNEEYHCDREEPLDREEPSAEPINLNNEEPNCCEPFTWALHRFQLRDLQSPQAMARKYMEREVRMLRRGMGCVPDYLIVPDPDDIMSYGFPDDPDEQLDYATCTSEEADGLMAIFDRVVQGGYHGSFAAFARANRPFVRETFPDATPRAVSDALVFAYTTMPYQETREKKAQRLIDEAAAAAFSITDLPDAETLPRPLRYASLYNNEEERKTDDIAEAIETCIRLAKGDLKTNDIVSDLPSPRHRPDRRHCGSDRDLPSPRHRQDPPGPRRCLQCRQVHRRVQRQQRSQRRSESYRSLAIYQCTWPKPTSSFSRLEGRLRTVRLDHRRVRCAQVSLHLPCSLAGGTRAAPTDGSCERLRKYRPRRLEPPHCEVSFPKEIRCEG